MHDSESNAVIADILVVIEYPGNNIAYLKI